MTLRRAGGVQMEVTNVSFQEGRNAGYRREFQKSSSLVNARRDLALTLHHLTVSGNIFSMKSEPKQQRSSG